MLYKLKRLKKVYNHRTVLDIEGLTLEKGQVTGLLGPNGSGKTTLLKILTFILEPTSGEIRFKGKRVDFASGKLIDLRRKVVLVQQQPILFTSTVANNVAFPLRIRKIEKTERERLVEELLELVGMLSFRDAMAHRLSGGETQRVAIARALACSPEVILMDEPTANVDVENQIVIERIIGEINQKREISVIFTSHNMIQASRLAEKTVFLFEGKVAQSTYENIFSGFIEEDEKGEKTCILQGGVRLHVKNGRPGPVRISIDPERIKVGQGDGDLSSKNAFTGRLIQLTDEHSRVRALVDVGIMLSALIQKERLDDLDIRIGMELWVRCPEQSIEVF
ncbi:MAG: ATP-binding cassette domain-containing protein [Deltaproteobacteria bacterium]|nr:MAG: ATP-binding cassette domain-containing protein [Deltaproteobacteria bacterium]